MAFSPSLSLPRSPLHRVVPSSERKRRNLLFRVENRKARARSSSPISGRDDLVPARPSPSSSTTLQLCGTQSGQSNLSNSPYLAISPSSLFLPPVSFVFSEILQPASKLAGAIPRRAHSIDDYSTIQPPPLDIPSRYRLLCPPLPCLMFLPSTSHSVFSVPLFFSNNLQNHRFHYRSVDDLQGEFESPSSTDHY